MQWPKDIFRRSVPYVMGSLAFLILPVIFSRGFFRTSHLIDIPMFRRDFISHSLLLIFFFVHHFYLLPRHYFRRRYVTYGLYLLLCYLVISFFPWIVEPGSLVPDTIGVRIPPEFQSNPSFFFKASQYFFQFFIILFFSLMVKINTQLKETEEQKLSAELAYLKAQVNPHFLFNSLNSIYSLAIDRSERTADAVVKLAGMMRYVMTDASRDIVSLEKEINYLTDYIDMQKVRLGDTVLLRYEIDVQNKELEIAPLLLIPFIENAFKYGVNPEEESVIRISLATHKNNLTLILENNKVMTRIDESQRHGIGLANTRARLRMLYPGRHDLHIVEDEKKFQVYLAIKL